jgi:hypothetical protein
MTFFKGTYAFIKISSADAFDYTYSTEVRNGEKSTQCIDFYYYITDASNNVKITVLWDDGETKQQIAQVKASSNTTWQHCRHTYNSPLSNIYHVS